MDPAARAIYAVTYLAAGWCWVFGIIGAAQRFFFEPSRQWRYIADSSFFVYLLHLPVVYLLQTWMIGWPMHWSLKFLLIVALTYVIVLAAYHYLVRSTFVGQFLNGRRYPRESVPVSAAPAR
jgi:peptidoglycan/LPS O-acetylase OafA/YrhL